MKNKKIFLVLGIVLLISAFSGMINARDFNIYNLTNPLQSYLSVNGLTGNVGVGTTSPGAKLDIRSDSQAPLEWGSSSISIGRLTYSGLDAQIYAESNGALSLGSNSIPDRMYIATDGNVGIGTTSPGAKLDIRGARIAVGDYLSNPVRPNTYGGAIEIGSDGQSVDSSLIYTYNIAQGVDNLVFDVGDNGNKIVMQSTGNVGIGTTAPNYKLSIQGPSGISSSALLSLFKTGGYGGTLFSEYYESSTKYGLNISGEGATLIQTGNDASGGNEGVYFPNGNVGIGTVSPGYKLDIKAQSSVSPVTFTGSGLNDATSGGTFTGTTATNYRVQIDSTGSVDTFEWSDDGGATWVATKRPILDVNYPVLLNNGVTISFASDTGHTLGDYWDFSTTVTNPLAIQNAAGTRSLYVGNDGKVGIGTTAPTYQLQLSTDSAAKPSTNTWTVASDKRIKKNINYLTNYTENLNWIKNFPNAITYNYNNLLYPQLQNITNYGFIAQDIKAYAPDMVTSKETVLTNGTSINMLSINTNELDVRMLPAIKGLINENNNLKLQISNLQNKLKLICQKNNLKC